MIYIVNKQRKVPVDIKQLKKNTQLLLEALHYADFDISIIITTNKTIRSYNNTYRHIDKPTDILSFPFHPTLKAGERIKPVTDDDKNLGDLLISAEYVQKAAQELDTTFEFRMKVLLVHGICHLLGYDHIKDSDYKAMRRKESILLKKI